MNLASQRLQLFPISATLEPAGEQAALHIAGLSLKELARQYGTPLYLYDQATLDVNLQAYRDALQASYPGEHGLTYAGKAFLCTAMAQWAAQRGLLVDCTGVGEIAIALAAGLAPASILVHGVNKSPQDLHAAVEYASIIVVDNPEELSQLLDIVRRSTRLSPHPFPELWLRLRPGVAVETHAYTQTGQHESKFGVPPEEALEMVRTCQENALPLRGLHFHLGSQFRDPAPLQSALQVILDFAVQCREQTGWLPRVICAGGGWGTPYHEADLPFPPIQDYVQVIAHALSEGCQQRNLPLPRLHLEPGRSLVARAGVALYRVGAVKTTPSRRWIIIDGGMADNPRPALYGTRYTALPVCNPDEPERGPAWLAGPYCESGDVLIEALPMPEVKPGDLIAVPVSGAYQLSMASNYNGALRPAVLWLNHSGAHLIQARETPDHLAFRDRPYTP